MKLRCVSRPMGYRIPATRKVDRAYFGALLECRWIYIVAVQLDICYLHHVRKVV